MKILILDNYDSFTYNLVHTVKDCGYSDIEVILNDHIEMDQVEKYDKIIFSPGPDIPQNAGRMLEIIHHFHATKPMLGICLGHQAIAEYFGASLINLKEVYHGIQSEIVLTKNERLFRNMKRTIEVGRYHSWVVDDNGFPDSLEITGTSRDHQIMAFQHQSAPIYGVQFHPESILTPLGKQIIYNFLTE